MDQPGVPYRLLDWDHQKEMKMAKKQKAKKYDCTGQDREDAIELTGSIEEALPGTLFRVLCDNACHVLCTLSGKMRLNHIKILPGDRVTIEVSPYDVTRGRVMWRMR